MTPDERSYITSLLDQRIALRAEVDRLTAQVQRVRELHVEYDGQGGGYCVECDRINQAGSPVYGSDAVDWPCRTIQVLDGES